MFSTQNKRKILSWKSSQIFLWQESIFRWPTFLITNKHKKNLKNDFSKITFQKQIQHKKKGRFPFLYLQKNSWTESCHDSTSISITKTPASPQGELPILSTQEGSGDGIKEALEPLRADMEEEVVLMAIISPASTIGRTKPELQFVS
jgi:hypothetical protein